MRMIRLSTRLYFRIQGKILGESLAVAFKPILSLCKSLFAQCVRQGSTHTSYLCARTNLCLKFFVTYLIPWFVNLKSGSVCEGILWSDSRPVAEEREDGGGGRRREWEGKWSKKNREGEIPHLTACTELLSGSQLCEQQRLYTPNTFFMSLKLKLSVLILTLHRTNWELLFAAKPDKQHKSWWHSQHMVQMFLKQRHIVALSYITVLLWQSRYQKTLVVISRVAAMHKESVTSCSCSGSELRQTQFLET